MSVWSPTCQRSLFKRYHSDKHLSEFLPTKWRQKINWHRYGTKLRHCHPMYTIVDDSEKKKRHHSRRSGGHSLSWNTHEQRSKNSSVIDLRKLLICIAGANATSGLVYATKKSSKSRTGSRRQTQWVVSETHATDFRARQGWETCSQRTNCTELHDLNTSTQPFIGHARQRHDYTPYWLAAAKLGRSVLG